MARFDLEGGVVERRDVLECLRSAIIFEDKIQGVHKIFCFLDVHVFISYVCSMNVKKMWFPFVSISFLSDLL